MYDFCDETGGIIKFEVYETETQNSTVWTIDVVRMETHWETRQWVSRSKILTPAAGFPGQKSWKPTTFT